MFCIGCASYRIENDWEYGKIETSKAGITVSRQERTMAGTQHILKLALSM